MAGVTWVTRQVSATLGLSPWQNWPLAGNARQAASPDGHLGNRYESEAINLSTLEILGSRDAVLEVRIHLPPAASRVRT
jgi:hypothetical protein